MNNILAAERIVEKSWSGWTNINRSQDKDTEFGWILNEKGTHIDE